MTDTTRPDGDAAPAASAASASAASAASASPASGSPASGPAASGPPASGPPASGPEPRPAVPAPAPPGADARTRRLQSLATVLASLVIPVPIVVGRFVEAALDTANPADVDVSAGLAYLREILGWGFGSLGVVIVAIVVVLTLVYRRTRTLDSLRLPLLVLVVQIVLGLLALLFAAIVGAAEG